jgi:hypothetical protein
MEGYFDWNCGYAVEKWEVDDEAKCEFEAFIPL